MGMGRFKNGRFDLVVVANFGMTATDVAQWKRSFAKASELFYDASEGQVQYGRIFVCDESIGIDSAEIILHPSGDPSYGTRGEFGHLGKALHLMPYVKFQVLTHLHEMGHHVWALGEEYARESVSEAIDTSVTPPGFSVIPLVSSAYAIGALVGNDAILTFGSSLERHRIIANTATSVTVDTAFSQSPVHAAGATVYYQFPAECATGANPNFCIMEHSRDAAGLLSPTGAWTPAANPVTEYCTDSNHDPDGDTQQEFRNHDSCWETIVARPGYTGLSAPDPASPGPSTGSTAPEWIVLDKQLRFSVVVDRSGSMAQGHRMEDAQHGAVYWLEYCSAGTDLLSVVAYDDQIETVLAQAEVASLGGLGGATAAIDALAPRGATDIRDALFRARDEIESLPTRAAAQVVLLLTDGIHNFPSGSSALEALGDLQEGGIRVYTLGVGTPSQIDMGALDAIATGTGGRSYAVGDDQPALIETKMVEINAEVRGGIITTEPVIFPDSRPSAIDKVIGGSREPLDPRKRPPLESLLKAARVSDPAQLRALEGSAQHGRLVSIPVDVEPAADRAGFTVNHPDDVDVWLYLLDPAGAVVDTSPGGSAIQVAGAAPHEFIIVDHPDPGRWTIVATRVRPGAAFEGHVVAGGENRNLQVFASAPAIGAAGAPVPISASARWRHALTGLQAQAVVTSPNGARRTVVLHDDLAEGGGSGDYVGVFTPFQHGRHEAIVTVTGGPGASLADPFRLLSHAEDDADIVDAALDVPAFVRRVVVVFEVGEPEPGRPWPEQPSGGEGRKRPVALRSAGRRRRAPSR
jgi:hypothetical protein